MKIRRLSEIDLARIAPLSSPEKILHLRRIKIGRPPHTYNPFRSQLGDILNLQPDLPFGASQATARDLIEAEVGKRCKTESERAFNLGVAKALHRFAVESQARSYAKPMTSWAVGYGQAVSYWWNFYTVMADKPAFIFVDPRLSVPFTRIGRKFVLSMMNERLRVNDPDFAESDLVICQFSKGADGERVVVPHFCGDDLFHVGELNDMIDETYRLWLSVLEERAESERVRPSGTNPMGF